MLHEEENSGIKKELKVKNQAYLKKKEKSVIKNLACSTSDISFLNILRRYHLKLLFHLSFQPCRQVNEYVSPLHVFFFSPSEFQQKARKTPKI